MLVSGVRIVSVLLIAALAAPACRTPDPQQEIAIEGLEAYWIVDSPVNNEQYIAPAVRFTLRNKGKHVAHSLQAKATFRREGEEWGGDWRRVTSAAGNPLQPGEQALVVLRSEHRYHSAGKPDSMFGHELFKDASVEVFLRLGSSRWTPFGQLKVERRIGARAVAAETP